MMVLVESYQDDMLSRTTTILGGGECSALAIRVEVRRSLTRWKNNEMELSGCSLHDRRATRARRAGDSCTTGEGDPCTTGAGDSWTMTGGQVRWMARLCDAQAQRMNATERRPGRATRARRVGDPCTKDGRPVHDRRAPFSRRAKKAERNAMNNKTVMRR